MPVGIEHDVTYKWQLGQTSVLTVTRQIVAGADGALSLSVPAGSANLPAAFSILLSKIQSIFLACDQAVTLKAGGVNAVQSLTMTGTPTGGTFTRTFAGQTTAPIPYNATAAQVQTALVALSTIGAGGVAVGGGPFPGTPMSLTFAGLNAVQAVSLTTGNDSALTGGSTPATATATTTAGGGPDTTIAVKAGVPLVWDAAGYFANPFAADVATFYLSNASGVAANLNLRTLSNQ